ncbi:MAG: CDP-alcohol phosphatidyltransferase [bacterium]
MSQDRERTNILKRAEASAIQFFCAHMPRWVYPDLLTAIGFFGSLVVCAGLWLARHSDRRFLLLSILGLAIHWFGDSLDGRLAYFRQTPRKWYGWALDINVDWTSACFIGLGFYFYLTTFRIVAFVFVVAYGGSMIVALLRYKITEKYTIDTFMFGPTELRILLATVLLIELYRPNTLLQFGFAGSLILVIINSIDSYKVLKLADRKDRSQKETK